MPEHIEHFLGYTLYRLFHLGGSADWVGVARTDAKAYREKYDPRTYRGIVEALRWVKDHPEADLTEVFPNLPFSNRRIHEYAQAALQAYHESEASSPSSSSIAIEPDHGGPI